MSFNPGQAGQGMGGNMNPGGGGAGGGAGGGDMGQNQMQQLNQMQNQQGNQNQQDGNAILAQQQALMAMAGGGAPNSFDAGASREALMNLLTRQGFGGGAGMGAAGMNQQGFGAMAGLQGQAGFGALGGGFGRFSGSL